MPRREDPNTRLPSTTFVWKRVKMSSRPKGSKSAPKGRHAWRRFPRLPLDRAITVRLEYSGGAEAWVRVGARGTWGSVPGWMSIIDVLRLVLNDVGDDRDQ